AWMTAVVSQAIAFGLIHAYQGSTQAISIGIGGAVYGAAFLLARRNLWPLVVAHGLNDTIGFIFLYSGVIHR
ncbi:MAG: CPBP family intramembrane metalloprotease, partial [Gemmatimonadetes bacterium]|nr:CPBP family intramembrane metalloprotease [Gemmatimonadota bacterium]